jgi:hypothetical protein
VRWFPRRAVRRRAGKGFFFFTLHTLSLPFFSWTHPPTHASDPSRFTALGAGRGGARGGGGAGAAGAEGMGRGALRLGGGLASRPPICTPRRPPLPSRSLQRGRLRRLERNEVAREAWRHVGKARGRDSARQCALTQTLRPPPQASPVPPLQKLAHHGVWQDRVSVRGGRAGSGASLAAAGERLDWRGGARALILGPPSPPPFPPRPRNAPPHAWLTPSASVWAGRVGAERE